jgi:hypothetical protein
MDSDFQQSLYRSQANDKVSQQEEVAGEDDEEVDEQQYC